MKHKIIMASLFIGYGSLYTGCLAEDVTILNQTFLNQFTGGETPIAPGPNAGYVMVMVQNSTEFSVEFIVTAEAEEIIVPLVNGAPVNAGESRLLEAETVQLITDVNSPTLGAVFDFTPAEFPPVAPGQLTFEDIQDILNQLVAKDPEALTDRDFIRLVRVIRIGFGEDLDVPASQDDGIVIRPSGSDPSTTAGSIFPSGLNKILSYDLGGDPADFGNGDLIIVLASTKASAVGGFAVTAGVIDGETASANSANFIRDTFEILRDVDGPISPLPPS
ncbi:MAG: hypothetical protein HJJLKODD_00074 [Phycisphaerae bacterium]|nr:hypothetical protein [Phycisphaerae bacterium]